MLRVGYDPTISRYLMPNAASRSVSL